MTVDEMIEEYMQALRKLEQRHKQLQEQIKVYDKRIALLEEEMDEIWEVIAMLKKHKDGKTYGWRSRGISAGGDRQRVSCLLGL